MDIAEKYFLIGSQFEACDDRMFFEGFELFGRFRYDDDIGTEPGGSSFAQITEGEDEVFVEWSVVFGKENVDGGFDAAVLEHIVEHNQLWRVAG